MRFIKTFELEEVIVSLDWHYYALMKDWINVNEWVCTGTKNKVDIQFGRGRTPLAAVLDLKNKL